MNHQLILTTTLTTASRKRQGWAIRISRLIGRVCADMIYVASLVSQCRGREESRLQCGYYNIERDECNKLGCCWRPTSTSGTPWCYQADSETSKPGFLTLCIYVVISLQNYSFRALLSSLNASRGLLHINILCIFIVV